MIMDLSKKIFAIIVGAVVIVLVWYLVLYFEFVSTILLPYPNKVINELFVLFTERSFWINIGTTIFTWVGGIIFGLFFGCIFGIILGYNQFIYHAFEPWIEFIRSLPSVVLVPLVALFFGVGIGSRLACSSIVVAVMLISNMGIAFRSVKNAHLKLAKSWKINNNQKILYFIAPAALSYLMVTLKSAIPIALIVAVAADMLIATDSGIGRTIMESLAVLNTTRLYAVIIVVGILGYFAALLSNYLEVITIHWNGR